jgi:hypothetical protein
MPATNMPAPIIPVALSGPIDTKRLTRCRRCHRPWADETSALDVVHIELVAEWDAPTNYPKTLQRTKATSKTVVS